jgi:hypothetical protein
MVQYHTIHCLIRSTKNISTIHLSTSYHNNTVRLCPSHALLSPPSSKTKTMAADLAQPTTYGCSPALLLSSKSASASAAAVVAARSKSAPGESSVVTDVVVHPIVLLSVLDHHTRRQEGAGRVIGTLLGKRDGDTVSSYVTVIFCTTANILRLRTVCARLMSTKFSPI